MSTPAPRPYRVDDLPRLSAFLGRCNVASGLLDSFHPGDLLHHLTNIMRGADPSPFFHVVDGPDGDPLAVITLTKRGSFEVIVHADMRGGEFERDMLRWAANEQAALLGRIGTSATEISIDGLDTDPVRMALLTELGFAAAPEPYMAHTIRDLRVPWPAPVLPDGFTIRSASGVDEADAIGAVHSSAFNSNWLPGVYRAVMQTPGFVIEREMLVVVPSGELAAFLVYWPDPVSKSGLFEPVGTGEQYQRRGLIRALMLHTFGLMRDAGMTHAIVNHMLDNPASSRAYESVGFVRKAVMTAYTRPLAAPAV